MNLAIKIVNGMRPRTIPGTPLEDINKSYLQNENEPPTILNNSQFGTNFSMSNKSINSFFENFSSRIYNFEGLSEARNATKG
ncbi:hypothetical protein C1645_835884 [Glomus cerebriforme]|uniref:Uncharacterized protein n=1 Tax=Glomus cerebriforme TaxID=658196 RepID=A0A397S819_9GLOM|nr:hypothetical protein C1645_835884 [Glomus cerebriforme]